MERAERNDVGLAALPCPVEDDAIFAAGEGVLLLLIRLK